MVSKVHCAFFTNDWKLIKEGDFEIKNGEISTLQENHSTEIYFIISGMTHDSIRIGDSVIFFKQPTYVYHENLPEPIQFIMNKDGEINGK